MSASAVRLLCVDDNALDVERIERLARRLGEPVHVTHAGDGVEALALLEQSHDAGEPLPDGILLDLNMPRLDGHACLDAMRMQERFEQLFVCIVSTSMRETDRERAGRLGADAYLVKAVESDNLVELLASIRRFRQPPR